MFFTAIITALTNIIILQISYRLKLLNIFNPSHKIRAWRPLNILDILYRYATSIVPDDVAIKYLIEYLCLENPIQELDIVLFYVKEQNCF